MTSIELFKDVDPEHFHEQDTFDELLHCAEVEEINNFVERCKISTKTEMLSMAYMIEVLGLDESKKMIEMELDCRTI